MDKKRPNTGNDTLENIKDSKKNSLSSICMRKITEGFTQELSGEDYYFRYNIIKQQNFSDTMRLFENNMINKIGWSAYLGEEKVRIQLDKETFSAVYLAGVKHKTDCLTRLNDVLYPLVDAAENKETVARIYWDEGLPSEELSLKDGKTVEDRVSDLNKKAGELEQSDRTLMMAIVQVSGLLGGV